MTKKPSGTISDQDFNALVDEQFKEPTPKRKQRTDQAWKPSDAMIHQLEQEGADPRLTKSQARFNAVISRCLGVPCVTPTDESVKFIQSVDKAGRAIAKERWLELRDDD